MPINVSLASKNCAQTKVFYAGIDFDVYDTAMQTCTVKMEDCSLIFFQQDANAESPGLSGTLYLFVKDVDAYYAQIKDRVDLEWPLQDMSYGTREFAIKDCNGYRLAFAQSRN